jgi:hypothetical protein
MRHCSCPPECTKHSIIPVKGIMNHIASPDHSDSGIEREILAKGLTAPRVTLDAIKAEIVSDHYFTASDGVNGYYGGEIARKDIVNNEALSLVTFCVLVLRNGFTVVGYSACASPENFDAEIGRKVARENARQNIWPLLGFKLKQQLFEKAMVEDALSEANQAIKDARA